MEELDFVRGSIRTHLLLHKETIICFGHGGGGSRLANAETGNSENKRGGGVEMVGLETVGESKRVKGRTKVPIPSAVGSTMERQKRGGFMHPPHSSVSETKTIKVILILVISPPT